MNFNEVLSDVIDKVAGWLDAALLMLPNLAAAVVIVVVGWLVARAVRRLVQKLMGRLTSYRQVNQLVATVAYIAALATATFVALNVLNLNQAVTSLLAGAGIVGLALGFAFQDIAANFISGVLISIRRPFRHGDIIESNDLMGTVSDVNLRSTVIRTFDGKEIIIPNKDVFGNPLINYSVTGQRRIDLACGVAYGDDLEKAQKVAQEALSGVPGRLEDRDIEVFYTEFGGSSIDLVGRIWIDFNKQVDYLKARSEAIKRLKTAFDENGITIPFPIRTIDFGVVGGVPLAEALPERALAERRGGAESEGHARQNGAQKEEAASE